MLSDHKPVYGIYKILIEAPMIINPPLFKTPRNPSGELHIKNLKVNYKFQNYDLILKYYKDKEVIDKIDVINKIKIKIKK